MVIVWNVENIYRVKYLAQYMATALFKEQLPLLLLLSASFYNRVHANKDGLDLCSADPLPSPVFTCYVLQ